MVDSALLSCYAILRPEAGLNPFCIILLVGRGPVYHHPLICSLEEEKGAEDGEKEKRAQRRRSHLLLALLALLCSALLTLLITLLAHISSLRDRVIPSRIHTHSNQSYSAFLTLSIDPRPSRRCFRPSLFSLVPSRKGLDLHRGQGKKKKGSFF